MEISSYLMALNSVWESLLSSASRNPFVWGVQVALVFAALVLVYTVFWTTRDILRRSRSIAIQLACVLLVSILPFVGFFLYIIVRPSRTLHDREVAEMLSAIHMLLKKMDHAPVQSPLHPDTVITRRTFFSTHGVLDETVKKAIDERSKQPDLVSISS